MSSTPTPTTGSRRRRLVMVVVAVTAATAGILALTLRSDGVELPPPPPTPTGPEVVTVVAVGDIACDPASSSFNGGEGTGTECAMRATSDLALGLDADAVLALGDLQYECGGYEAFLASYDPSWGRLKDITHPVPGNHEYEEAAASGSGDGTDCSAGPDASGYFRYFGEAAGAPGQGCPPRPQRGCLRRAPPCPACRAAGRPPRPGDERSGEGGAVSGISRLEEGATAERRGQSVTLPLQAPGRQACGRG